MYEDGNKVFIGESSLKVMMEEDYFATQQNANKVSTSGVRNKSVSVRNPGVDVASTFVSQIMREVVLPAIQEEVNNGENFSQLRQIYNSLILAVWMKKRIAQRAALNVYINQKKTVGVENAQPTIKQDIYQQYLKSAKFGAYNFVRKEKNVYRRYFSGGCNLMTLFQDEIALPVSQFPVSERAVLMNQPISEFPLELIQIKSSEIKLIEKKMFKNKTPVQKKNLDFKRLSLIVSTSLAAILSQGQPAFTQTSMLTGASAQSQAIASAKVRIIKSINGQAPDFILSPQLNQLLEIWASFPEIQKSGKIVIIKDLASWEKAEAQPSGNGVINIYQPFLSEVLLAQELVYEILLKANPKDAGPVFAAKFFNFKSRLTPEAAEALVKTKDIFSKNNKKVSDLYARTFAFLLVSKPGDEMNVANRQLTSLEAQYFSQNPVPSQTSTQGIEIFSLPVNWESFKQLFKGTGIIITDPPIKPADPALSAIGQAPAPVKELTTEEMKKEVIDILETIDEIQEVDRYYANDQLNKMGRDATIDEINRMSDKIIKIQKYLLKLNDKVGLLLKRIVLDDPGYKKPLKVEGDVEKARLRWKNTGASVEELTKDPLFTPVINWRYDHNDSLVLKEAVKMIQVQEAEERSRG